MPDLDLVFKHHPSFEQELERFISKHCDGRATVELTLTHHHRLLLAHFVNKSVSYTAKHLGPAQGFGAYQVFWLHMIVPDSRLTRTQQPKAYFYKSPSSISFLCLSSHTENYKDSELRVSAQQRLKEILELLKNEI